jgi:hypothetical protein
MQRDTFNPSRISDDAGRAWWFSRQDRRYHVQAGDRGRAPSEFYSQTGALRAGFQEVRR